jgi:type IV secretion system protein VirD4
MKHFTKLQIAFLILVMFVITFSLGSSLTYYWYFGSIFKAAKHFQWWRIFEILLSPEVPLSVKYAGYKFVGIGFCVSLICPVIGYLFLLKKGDQSLYGDAKFASLSDIQKSNSVSLGTSNTKGIVVGKYNGKLIRYTKPDFVSLGAGTRSGKGASIVIPNLLEWQDSLIVLDIKQECFNITSKYRKEVLNQDVFLFNPFSLTLRKMIKISII